MSLLNQVETGTKKSPRKIVIYGPAKIGKSTFAASAPSALLMRLEDRVDDIDCAKTPLITTYNQFMDWIEELVKGDHQYKTLIIDPIGNLEHMLHTYLCEKNKWESITSNKHNATNFNRGLSTEARNGWREVVLYNLDVVRKSRDMNIILIGHEAKAEIKPPDNNPYYKYIPAIDIHSVPEIERWADIIGYYGHEVFVSINEKTKKGQAIGSNRRLLSIDGTNPAILSGNSYHLGNIEVTLEHCSEIMAWLLMANNKPKKEQESKNKK